jgi:hypothetical protein
MNPALLNIIERAVVELPNQAKSIKVPLYGFVIQEGVAILRHHGFGKDVKGHTWRVGCFHDGERIHLLWAPEEYVNSFRHVDEIRPLILQRWKQLEMTPAQHTSTPRT